MFSIIRRLIWFHLVYFNSKSFADPHYFLSLFSNEVAFENGESYALRS